jgi:hypothetical protein
MTSAPASAPTPHPQHTDFGRLFTEIANNRLPVPHFEEMDPVLAIGHIAANTLLECSPVCWVSIPEIDGGRGNYARLLAEVRHGKFTGSGFILIFTAAGIGKAGRFAICKHNIVAGADANPRRGWRPARCVNCGADFSTDSSD